MHVQLLDEFKLTERTTVTSGLGSYPVELEPGTWCAAADGIFLERVKRVPAWHPARKTFFPRPVSLNGGR